MRVSGLIISYKNGMNVLTGTPVTEYPVGDLLCRIFQGETLDNITRILRNCINACPMRDNFLTQDEIEDAEHYILQALLYDDFKPAQRLAQGSFIRCMECYRALDSTTAGQFLYQERARAAESDMLFEAIGFDTVGDFLRLCYNNYIIDLYNALTLFIGMAAVKSGTASPEEQAAYNEIRRYRNAYGLRCWPRGIRLQLRYQQLPCHGSIRVFAPDCLCNKGGAVSKSGVPQVFYCQADQREILPVPVTAESRSYM